MKTDTPSARSSRNTASRQSIINLILAALILGMVNYVAFKHYTHKDLSQSQFYTLSPKTIDVLKNLGHDLQLNAWLQYERWKVPIYIAGQNSDTTVAFQITYFPKMHALPLHLDSYNGSPHSPHLSGQQNGEINAVGLDSSIRAAVPDA